MCLLEEEAPSKGRRSLFLFSYFKKEQHKEAQILTDSEETQ